MMPAKSAVKRAAALLVAVGLFVSLIAAASADDGDTEASASAALQPTQVVADIPEEYGVLFPLQWGGGTLLQFKGRLATMGCIVDTIWLYDEDRWYPYNQYQTPKALTSNVEFRTKYSELVPAGTMYANCFNFCELGGKECIPHEEMRKRTTFGSEDFPVSIQGVPCMDDFHSIVKERVFPILPMHPDVCIIKVRPFWGGLGRGLATFQSIQTPPFVMVEDKFYKHATERDKLWAIEVEIHELCHMNQAWHWIQ